MPEIVIVILAVLFVLGVAVNIHEFGHFIVAKLLGMRVEAYSFFGLGPRIWGIKVGHTDYRIGAIPLGAYVKLYGDEATSSLEGGSSDGEAAPDSELYELRPRWQKLLVMLGGPFMNILLALAIPFGLAMWLGVPAPPSPVVGWVKTDGAADKAGIKPGDRVVGFDGLENPEWIRVTENALLSPEKEMPITVERDGKRHDLTIIPSKKVRKGDSFGVLDWYSKDEIETVYVKAVEPGKPAAEAGLMVEDEIVTINGMEIPNRGELIQVISGAKANPINMTINRAGSTKEITVTPQKIDENTYQIGIRPGSRSPVVREAVGLTGALGYAANENWRVLRLTGAAFGQMFSGERAVSDGGIRGPIGIVEFIADTVKSLGFVGLLPLLMMISLSLGVFNLLPIPMLDGGQIAVLGIEAVLAMFGLKLSRGIQEKIQLAGLAIILLLMVVVMYLDISRIIG